MEEWKLKAIDLAANTKKSWRKIAKELGKPKSSVSDFLRAYYKEKEESKGAKVLVLDIETKYMLLQGWQLFNQNFSLDQIEEDWSILSYSAKWYGEEVVIYKDVTEATEVDLLEELWELLDKADFVIAHNGRKFDIKKIRARMVTEGFKPYSPVRAIDTLEIVKQEFGFTSNKLAYLTNLLCKKSQKLSHSEFAGHLLWKEFVKGNPKAIQVMRDYNSVDVTSLEELYDIIAPWSSKLPNFDLYEEKMDMTLWEEDGYHYSNLGKYKRYRHKTSGKCKRGRANLLSKEERKDILANIII